MTTEGEAPAPEPPLQFVSVMLDRQDWDAVMIACGRAADRHHSPETTCVEVGRRRLRYIMKEISDALRRTR